jgi:hypothetical protein
MFTKVFVLILNWLSDSSLQVYACKCTSSSLQCLVPSHLRTWLYHSCFYILRTSAGQHFLSYSSVSRCPFFTTLCLLFPHSYILLCTFRSPHYSLIHCIIPAIFLIYICFHVVLFNIHIPLLTSFHTLLLFSPPIYVEWGDRSLF